MANLKLRQYAKTHNVYFWEIARYLNVCENTITRKMRVELSDEESSEIMRCIDEIAKEKIKEA